jgi:hypothetical protein
MGKCSCMFTTDAEGMCNGTHKVVAKVRKSIGDEIALMALPSHYDQLKDPIKMFVHVRDYAERIARDSG